MGGGGGVGISLNKPCRNVPPQWVRFFGRLGPKTGLDFAHFGLESRMGFEGTSGV